MVSWNNDHTMWTTLRLPSCLVLCSALWLILAVVQGGTILYTNSPRHLVTSENYTSYKLAVPGADPITIIEATQGPPKEAGDAYSGPGSLNEMRRQNWISDESFLFRRKDNGGHNEEIDQSKPRTTVYSPDLLKKFLDDYADKVKTSSPETKQKLQEILLFDDDNEDENFPLNSQPEEKYGHNQPHDWNQNNKFDDRKYERPNSGWVTMDVMPWSTSKVSKWQGHVQRLPNRPQSDHSRPDYVSMDDFDDRFQHSSQSYHQNSYHRPNRPSYNDFDDVDRFSSSSAANHHQQEPQRPPPPHRNQNKYHENKPSYYDYQTSQSLSSHQYHSPPPPDKHTDIYRPWGGDIITDNRAPDFPDHPSSYPNSNRRPGDSSYDNYGNEYRPYQSNKSTRPTASPDSGNGDWILVSTTKGYHRPRHGQRAVAVKTQPLSSHKHVHMSATAAEKPQSSHQSSTFSFDSESHYNNNNQDQSAEQSLHSSAAQRPNKKLSSMEDQQQQQQQQQKKKQQKKVVKKVMSIQNPGVDSSAVLAAVGAGMVPATMAMLMPIIAGRRKKRDLSAAIPTAMMVLGRPRNVTHFPDLDYEETLQRILQKHVR